MERGQKLGGKRDGSGGKTPHRDLEPGPGAAEAEEPCGKLRQYREARHLPELENPFPSLVNRAEQELRGKLRSNPSGWSEEKPRAEPVAALTLKHRRRSGGGLGAEGVQPRLLRGDRLVQDPDRGQGYDRGTSRAAEQAGAPAPEAPRPGGPRAFQKGRSPCAEPQEVPGRELDCSLRVHIQCPLPVHPCRSGRQSQHASWSVVAGGKAHQGVESPTVGVDRPLEVACGSRMDGELTRIGLQGDSLAEQSGLQGPRARTHAHRFGAVNQTHAPEAGGQLLVQAEGVARLRNRSQERPHRSAQAQAQR